MTYPLDTNYEYRPPTQSPINPPYSTSVDMKKQDLLSKPVVKGIDDNKSVD